MKKLFSLLVLPLLISTSSFAQTRESQEIRACIQRVKNHCQSQHSESPARARQCYKKHISKCRG